jgi:hypothetical protein
LVRDRGHAEAGPVEHGFGDLAARWVADQITLSGLRQSAPVREIRRSASSLLEWLFLQCAAEWLFCRAAGGL